MGDVTRTRAGSARWLRGALVAGGLCSLPAIAADAPQSSTQATVPASRPSSAPASGAVAAGTAQAAGTAPVDAELLEFLGSDDLESELQQFVATREQAASPARAGSGKK